jgi:hypothetical protein
MQEFALENVRVYTKTKKIQVYCDGGHGWAKVRLDELANLGINKKISSFSYTRGAYAYLEEDCDLGIYDKALREQGIKPDYTLNISYRRSKIRGYARYSAEYIYLLK